MMMLLDTHAFFWWIADSGRLSAPARTVIADELDDIAFSAASAWKITTKFRIGRLPGCETVVANVAGHITEQDFVELETRAADAERAGRLTGAHRDPFHRMLAAQALARDIPVVSVDPVLEDLGVVRLW